METKPNATNRNLHLTPKNKENNRSVRGENKEISTIVIVKIHYKLHLLYFISCVVIFYDVFLFFVHFTQFISDILSTLDYFSF